MTTMEKAWKRRQALARRIQFFKRATGASWMQMHKFSGVNYTAIRDYYDVRKEINEDHFKKLQYMFDHKAEFMEFITPPEKFCVDCGVSVGRHPNSCRCDACKAKHKKEYTERYREQKRQERAANTPEKIAKARQTKKEKMMFKGMSDNMRAISAIEVEARSHGSNYGRYRPIYEGRME